MLGELWATLIDAARYGDWRGHLAAWWAVATGQVTPWTRVGQGLPDRRNHREIAATALSRPPGGG